MAEKSKKKRGGGVKRKRGSSEAARRTLAFAIVLLAVACLIFVAVAVGASGDGQPMSPVSTETPEVPTATPVLALDTATPVPQEGTPVPQTATQPPPTFGPELPCGNILVPLGKASRLPFDCEPTDLEPLPDRMSYVVDTAIVMRADAATAMVEMLDAAADDGYVILVRSAYRSYGVQERTYQYWVDTLGQEAADRSSARPGHSEHQLGTTADVTSASNGYGLEGFENTPESQWVAENAHRFGFVISYPEGAEEVTGYIYEPWHLRFVGAAVAQQILDSGLTPIEFLEGG